MPTAFQGVAGQFLVTCQAVMAVGRPVAYPSPGHYTNPANFPSIQATHLWLCTSLTGPTATGGGGQHHVEVGRAGVASKQTRGYVIIRQARTSDMHAHHHQEHLTCSWSASVWCGFTAARCCTNVCFCNESTVPPGRHLLLPAGDGALRSCPGCRY